MKITSKTLMVNFETEVKLGKNDAIELTLVHHAFISEDGIDTELGVDVTDVKFLGVEIEPGYKAYNEFKDSLLKLGIDIDNLIDEKIDELKENDIENKLKLMFASKF